MNIIPLNHVKSCNSGEKHNCQNTKSFFAVIYVHTNKFTASQGVHTHYKRRRICIQYVVMSTGLLSTGCSWQCLRLVSRGQTLFRTEGKGLGFGRRATCRPAPWSAYQSQHSIQSHDTWSMWLTGKFKISVWIECKPEAREVRTEREVSWDISWNTAELKSQVQKGRKSYFAIICTIAMWRHGWIYMTN